MPTPAAPTNVAKRRKLPIGIQTFREIREDDCYDVDQTGLAVDLVEPSSHVKMNS